MRDLEGSRRADVARLVIAEGARFPALAATYRRLALEPLHAMIRHGSAGSPSSAASCRAMASRAFRC